MDTELLQQLLTMVGNAGEGSFVLAVVYLMFPYFKTLTVVWILYLFFRAIVAAISYFTFIHAAASRLGYKKQYSEFNQKDRDTILTLITTNAVAAKKDGE